MNAYTIVLVLHSWVRWLIVVGAVVALVRALRGWSGDRPWEAGDRVPLVATVGMLDLQLLVGLLLYFVLSPMTPGSFEALGASMKSSVTRFWAVEHGFGMLLAVVAAHVTSVRVRRAPDARKHRTAAIGIIVMLVLLAASMPWPFLPYGRPLVRF